MLKHQGVPFPLRKKTALSQSFRAEFLFASLLIFSAGAFAQSSGPVLEEIVVTARKRTESSQDVPVTVTAFSEDRIASSGIERPQDFINLTPNVQMVQTQNQGVSFIVARGIGQARNSEPSVAVVVDGVLQSNPEMFNVELFDIEHIEVLKGPQGALYGRNAIGGAIIVDTLAPSDDFEGSIKVGADNGPGFRVRATAAGPITDTLKYRIGTSYKDTDGIVPNTFLDNEADAFEDFSTRVRLLWEPLENFSADLIGNVILTNSRAFAFAITEDVDEILPIRVNNPGKNERDSYNASLKMQYDMDFATLTSVTAWNKTDEFSSGDAFDFLPIPDSFLANLLGFPLDLNQVSLFKTDAISQEFRLTSPDTQSLRWVVGSYFISTDRFVSLSTRFDTGNGIDPEKRNPSSNPLNLPTSFLSDKQDNFAFAFFGDLVYDINDYWQAEAAIRYDNDQRDITTLTPDAPLCFPDGFTPTPCLPDPTAFEGERRSTRFDSIQPKFTLRYQPTDTVTIYSSWGKGFRSGGFNQTGVASVAARLGIAGVDDIFEAQTARTVELGLKTQLLDQRLNLNFAAYHTSSKGEPFFVFIAENSTQNLGTIGKVKHNGFEISMEALVTDGLILDAGIGFNDSKIKRFVDDAALGNESPLVTRVTSNIGLEYRYPTQLFNLDLVFRADYQRLGRTWWEPFNTTSRDPVNLLDLRASLQNDDWTLTGWSKNLTDNHYNSEFSPGGFTFRAPLRSWGFDVTRRF
ncbi:MAG: TonB-dependent receptor [Pseudomonadales bacterium]|nr:TonB-dependent receptor [Pseudomonadales bacterium]